MRKVINHLKKSDPVLAKIIAKAGPCKITYRPPVFETLARAIVFQQLSTKAARTIYDRFAEAAGGRVTPESVRNLSVGEMRACGLSSQKIGYIRDLAEHAAEGELDFRKLETMSDAEVVSTLTRVKGIGDWTAHMFLIFALRRENVLPVGDLGVKSAIKKAYGKRYRTKDKLPAPAHIQALARNWHPYCSIASWYLWRSLDGPAE